jgi:hypothetical protein
MRKFDQSYDIILTYSPIDEITGHLFECFDYYLFLRKHMKVGIVFFGGMSLEKIRTAFTSKYTVPFGEIEDDITYITQDEFMHEKVYVFGKDTVVLLCDGNIHQLELYGILLMARHLLGFMCGEKDEAINTSFPIYRNMVYLKDYRIYKPNRYYRTFDYVKKLPFEYYRKPKRKYDNTGMFYVTFACRKVTPDVIQEYHYNSGCAKSILIVPKLLPEYDDLDDIEQFEAPVENLFDRFDKYIYTPVKRQFDCSPRLVTECFLHGKEVMIDLNYVDIGLQTRYSDCKRDIETLNLTENDRILEIIHEIREN